MAETHRFVGQNMRFDHSGSARDLAERSGKRCVVIRELTDKECDREEVGPMFEIEFVIDEKRFHAFEDELSDSDCEEPQPDTCEVCGEIAVGADDIGDLLCASCYRNRRKVAPPCATPSAVVFEATAATSAHSRE